MASGKERPVIINNSTTISIEAESDFPSKIIMKNFHKHCEEKEEESKHNHCEESKQDI
jgi:hypothetical protein